MKIGNLDVHYVSHVCFILRSPEGATLITDPFFGDGFAWQGGYERYLSPPEFPATDITACDAVFVSHIHGDHFDPDAVVAIRKQTGCRVLASPDVIDVLLERGEAAEGLVALSEGTGAIVGDMAVTAMAGYDNSADEQGRSNKFSLHVTCGDTRVFYSGDCHEAPPAMRGGKVDAILWWPHSSDDTIRAFAEGIDFEQWVLMHGDRFDPGNFLCNLDMAEQAERVAKLAPDAKIIVPERLDAFPG